MDPWKPLEVKAQFDCFGPRCDVVRTAERRVEVVECRFVGQVDHGELKALPIAVSVKEVVMADGYIEQVSRLDSLRVMVIV
jgi:hypothetical protein